jgi:hypothetical protein
MTPTSNISLLAVVTILLAPAGVVTRVVVIAVLTNRLMNKPIQEEARSSS